MGLDRESIYVTACGNNSNLANDVKNGLHLDDNEFSWLLVNGRMLMHKALINIPKEVP
jgi:hypothetical protein